MGTSAAEIREICEMLHRKMKKATTPRQHEFWLDHLRHYSHKLYLQKAWEVNKVSATGK